MPWTTSSAPRISVLRSDCRDEAADRQQVPVAQGGLTRCGRAFDVECMLQDAWTRSSAQERSLMSSVSSLGGDASQRWQLLKESRANQATDSGGANRTRPSRGPPAASDPSAIGSVDASGNPAAAGGLSSASAKVISDLKALFIDLQSGASATTGASGANAANASAANASAANASAANATAASTTSGTASTAVAAAAEATTTAAAAGTSTAASAQSDLKTPAGSLGKVGGHHSHRAPSAYSSSTALATGTATSATAGQPAPKPAGGLLGQLVGALKAYAASSNDNSAKATTSLSA